MTNFPIFWRNEQQNPFQAMTRLQRQMDRIFSDLAGGNWSAEHPSLPEVARPVCDIEETDAHYLMSFDLPGMRKEDIQVEFTKGQLRVSGVRKDERDKGKGNRYRSEKYYGSVERTISLPQDVKAEQIEAQFDNGVLHIALPKAEAIKPKQIPVGDAKGGIFSKLLGKTSKEEKSSKEKAA